MNITVRKHKSFKSALYLPILLAAFLLLAGCGQATSSGFKTEDIYLNIDGGKYRCDTNIQEVIATLGDNYEYSEARSCDYDGLDKKFFYDIAEFYTFPLEEGDMINEIYTQSPLVTTSKGLSVGVSRDDVLAAYGNECDDTGYQLVYQLPEDDDSLCFDLENGLVTAIYITTVAV